MRCAMIATPFCFGGDKEERGVGIQTCARRRLATPKTKYRTSRRESQGRKEDVEYTERMISSQEKFCTAGLPSEISRTVYQKFPDLALGGQGGLGALAGDGESAGTIGKCNGFFQGGTQGTGKGPVESVSCALRVILLTCWRCLPIMDTRGPEIRMSGRLGGGRALGGGEEPDSLRLPFYFVGQRNISAFVSLKRDGHSAICKIWTGP